MDYSFLHPTMRRQSLLFIPLFILLVLAAGPAGAASVVGRTVSAGARLDGVAVPSGTTLLSPAVVQAGSAPAILHLRNGSVVAVAPQSVVRFEVGDDGRLRMSVEAGQVAYADPVGEVVELAEHDAAIWSAGSRASRQAEAQIGEGAPATEEQVRLCELIDWTEEKWELCTRTDRDASSCDRRLLIVPESEALPLVGTKAVYAGEKNDLGLDVQCRSKKAGVGLGTKIGFGIGAGLGAWLIDEVESDDEPPASPVTPNN